MHSGFPAGRSEQMIMMSLCDVTRISCAIEGGKYKRKAQLSLGAVVAVIGCSSTKHLGLLASHRPSTLAVLVPL